MVFMMNEFKDQEWEEYWLPKIEAECRQYKLQKQKNKKVIKDFIGIHIAVGLIFLFLSIVLCLCSIIIQNKNTNNHTINVPYTHRNID